MGIDPRTLSIRSRQAIAKAITLQRQRCPVRGSVTLWIDGEPPTTTHQDKTIAMRKGKQTLRDSAALQAVEKHYMLAIPENHGGPILPPLVLRVEFRFSAKSIDDPPAAPHLDKPDLDNLTKTLVDVLATRGWIDRDERVFHLEATKVRVGRMHFKPGVLVSIGTAAGLVVVLTPDKYLPIQGQPVIQRYDNPEGVNHAP